MTKVYTIINYPPKSKQNHANGKTKCCFAFAKRTFGHWQWSR